MDKINPKQLILMATLGSVLLLGGAFVFQSLGYPPCKLCIWQRWPHAIAIALGVVVLLTGYYKIGALMAVSLATTGAIGVYHYGVEQKWWEGPKSCSGGIGDGQSAADLLAHLMESPVIKCTDIVWQFGLTMAGWNAVFSFGLALMCVCAVVHRRNNSQ